MLKNQSRNLHTNASNNTRLKIWIKENYLILLILLVSFIKGIVWVYAIPLLHAPDEHRHYATIQYYAEPKNYKPMSHDFPLENWNFFDFNTHNLSPELSNATQNLSTQNLINDTNFKDSFSENSSFGPRENNIRNFKGSRFVEKYPPQIINYSPLYYKITAFIENQLSIKNANIIEKVTVIRIISVFILLLFIIISYLSFKELSFTPIESAAMAGAISFQPMLTFIFSIINVDALLILSFGIFLLGALHLLKNSWTVKNASLLLGSTFLAINTKPTGYFLAVASLLLIIFSLFLHQKEMICSYFSIIKRSFFLLLVFFTSIVLIISTAGFLIFNQIHRYFEFAIRPFFIFKDYILYQLQPNIMLDRSLSYWGNFGSPNVPINQVCIYFIWLILVVAALGIILKIFLMLKNYHELDFQKKILFFQLLFLFFMVIGLDFMMHYVNFLGANSSNFAAPFSSIGTPGRYFLPVIGAKFALITVGFSTIFGNVSHTKIIFALLILMILLNSIALFNCIIPHYYL